MQSKDFKAGTAYSAGSSRDVSHNVESVMLTTDRYLKTRHGEYIRTDDRARLANYRDGGIGSPSLRRGYAYGSSKFSSKDLRDKASQLIKELENGASIKDLRESALADGFSLILEIPSHIAGEWDLEQVRIEEQQKLNRARHSARIEQANKRTSETLALSKKISRIVGYPVNLVYDGLSISISERVLADLASKQS